jgi:hypothetical protein
MVDVLITDYTSLRSVVAQWMARENSARFVDQVPLFVQLTESKINNRLRVAEQSLKTTLTFAANSGTAALPADFGGLRGLPTDPGTTLRPLDYFVPSQFDSVFRDPELRDLPRIYTIRAQNMEIKPIPSEETSLTITYYRFVPALRGEVGGTNWLLDRNPDIYFAGSMHHAHAFQSNAERAGQWFTLFEAGMEALEDADWNDRWSGSPVISQPSVIEGAPAYPRFRFQGRN